MEYPSLHTQAEHERRLHSLCRVCAGRVVKSYHRPKAKVCANHKSDLLKFFKMDIDSDIASKHSQLLCQKCYDKIKNVKQRSWLYSDCSRTLLYARECMTKSDYVWQVYDGNLTLDECSVCTQFEMQCKGGRPHKPCRRAMKRAPSPENAVANDDISSSNTPGEMESFTAGNSNLSTTTATTSSGIDCPEVFSDDAAAAGLLTVGDLVEMRKECSSDLECSLKLSRIPPYCNSKANSLKVKVGNVFRKIKKMKFKQLGYDDQHLEEFMRRWFFPPNHIEDMGSRRLRLLDNSDKFMANFDPEKSSREMRKMERRIYKESVRKNQLFDEEGRLLENSKDLCDCLVLDCPGCHFPCPKCGSEKCGLECRCNRRWCYEQMQVEGTTLLFRSPSTGNTAAST